MKLFLNNELLEDGRTLSDYNIQANDYIKTSNAISELATKELRQKAKLDLAAAKRAADGNPRATYDITQLPTQYDDNGIINNDNTGGLLLGRPWVESAAAAGIITDNLQLYLEPTAYSGSGTSWIDSSTNTYDVTLVGDHPYNTTHFTYNGTAQYVNTNQSLAAESFSVGCWFRTSAAGVKMILSKETTAGNPWNYRIWLNGGRIVADMSQVATQATLNSVLTNYNNGAWYNVMFTRDDSNWFLYVNGVQIATRTDPYTGSVVNSQELWIGRSAFTSSGSSPTGSYQYTGDIGQVFVYNRVLSATEIQQNYDAAQATYDL
jgi:hypothetical protein